MEKQSPQQQKAQISSQSALVSANDSQNGSIEAEHHAAVFQSGAALLTWLCICIVGFLTLGLTLTARHIFTPGLRVGDKISHNIRASHSTMVVDEIATQREIQKAKDSLIPVFRKNETRNIESVAALTKKLDSIVALQKAGLVPLPDTYGVSPNEHLLLLNLEAADFTAINSSEKSSTFEPLKIRIFKEENQSNARFNKQAILATILAQRKYLSQLPAGAVQNEEKLLAVTVKPADMVAFANRVKISQTKLCKIVSRLPIEESQSVLEETAAEFLPDDMAPSLKAPASILMAQSAKPNLEIDSDATLAKAEKLTNQIKPVMKHINVGQVIVPQNSILSRNDIETLESVGLSDVNRWPLILSLWLSLAAAVALVSLFLYAYEPKHLFSAPSVALVFTVAILTCVAAATIGKVYPMLVPLPAVALVLTIFFDQRLAVAVVAPLTIFMAVDNLVEFNSLIALGFGAGAAIGTYSRHRHALMTSGLLTACAQAIGYLLAVSAFPHDQAMATMWKMVAMQFGGGMLSALLAIGCLPFLENIFGMVTPFRLAELTDADQPLLRRLEENAPGTYQHSLAVANLAEAGARAINVDVNLVRAGAFYHDIGKMVRPRFFIENQLGDKNPHDTMTPEESRERVLAHVTDGIDLAKEYNLPKAVQDFIPMHQGTSLMAYFYHKACVRDGIEKVDPNFYRYPGPKPQSKETSIVMLADVSEAVTHSMHDPSQAEVEAAISKVFTNRWEDGQFSEATLTFVELEKIKMAFVHVWRTLHHERLKYPSTTTGKMAVPPQQVPPTVPSQSTPVSAQSITTSTTGQSNTVPAYDPVISPPTDSCC
jgi:putative nucleotidyltransferase with HDIG domain